MTQKNIVEWGSGAIDNMMAAYEMLPASQNENEQKTILIATSWQKDNILDSCIEQILDGMKTLGLLFR